MIEFDPDIIADAIESFDYVLDEKGKTCRLFYEGEWEACACAADDIGNKPHNHNTDGGPIPIHSVCHLCGDTGQRVKEVYDDIKMTIDWTPKQYKYSGNVRIPDGAIVSRGYLSDMPKVLNCIKMQIMDTDIAVYRNYLFKLYGEPSDRFGFIPGRYFIAVWSRA